MFAPPWARTRPCVECHEETPTYDDTCEDCADLIAHGWNRCPSCQRLNMQPMHPFDVCYDCCDALDAADDAAYEA
jgi:hypothetical protein